MRSELQDRRTSPSAVEVEDVVVVEGEVSVSSKEWRAGRDKLWSMVINSPLNTEPSTNSDVVTDVEETPSTEELEPTERAVSA